MIAYHVRGVSVDLKETTVHAVEKDGYPARWWAESIARQWISRRRTLAVYVSPCRCPEIQSICNET